VIKNIPDNSKVMGYPSKDLKKFIKENKWFIKQPSLILVQLYLIM
jgi:hypothetical protein